MKTDYSMVLKIVGKRVKEKRKAKGMNQTELALKVDLSRVSVTNIELGRQSTSLKTLILIADSLNCDISELIPRIR
jgi:transcriptional regulator with XRE-family HTH domain